MLLPCTSRAVFISDNDLSANDVTVLLQYTEYCAYNTPLTEYQYSLLYNTVHQLFVSRFVRA